MTQQKLHQLQYPGLFQFSREEACNKRALMQRADKGPSCVILQGEMQTLAALEQQAALWPDICSALARCLLTEC